jgi:hypothetical protein
METVAAQSIPRPSRPEVPDIAELIAGDVAEVLAPLLDEAIRARILERLAG